MTLEEKQRAWREQRALHAHEQRRVETASADERMPRGADVEAGLYHGARKAHYENLDETVTESADWHAGSPLIPAYVLPATLRGLLRHDQPAEAPSATVADVSLRAPYTLSPTLRGVLRDNRPAMPESRSPVRRESE